MGYTKMDPKNKIGVNKNLEYSRTYIKNKKEDARQNNLQEEILLKNHGSLKAIIEHRNSINSLINGLMIRAKELEKDTPPYYVIGKDEQPLLVDPVSIRFHDLMNKAKFRAGLTSCYTPHVKREIDPEEYLKSLTKKNKLTRSKKH